MTNVILLSIERVYASQQRTIMFLRISYMYTNSISVESSIMECLILFKIVSGTFVFCFNVLQLTSLLMCYPSQS